MSERALLARFDLVTDNPENIPLLRHYIVDLAIRGKLLEKSALDISAPEMLKRIEAKADSLIKQSKLKKQKPLAAISAEELPATYIAHCTFERLGNVANLQKGLTGIQSAMPGKFPLVATAAARSTCDHFDFDGAAAIVPMVSSTGHGHASLNRLHYQEGKFALGTILCAVFPIEEELVSARFLFEYLTAFKDELLVSKMNGTANVTLTVGKIAEVSYQWQHVQRGTLQHEILEGKNALAFVDGNEAVFKVNCSEDGGKLPDPVPFALCVSLEVAEGIELPIYQQIRERVSVRVGVQS